MFWPFHIFCDLGKFWVQISQWPVSPSTYKQREYIVIPNFSPKCWSLHDPKISMFWFMIPQDCLIPNWNIDFFVNPDPEFSNVDPGMACNPNPKPVIYDPVYHVIKICINNTQKQRDPNWNPRHKINCNMPLDNMYTPDFQHLMIEWCNNGCFFYFSKPNSLDLKR